MNLVLLDLIITTLFCFRMRHLYQMFPPSPQHLRMWIIRRLFRVHRSTRHVSIRHPRSPLLHQLQRWVVRIRWRNAWSTNMNLNSIAPLPWKARPHRRHRPNWKLQKTRAPWIRMRVTRKPMQKPCPRVNQLMKQYLSRSMNPNTRRDELWSYFAQATGRCLFLRVDF